MYQRADHWVSYPRIGTIDWFVKKAQLTVVTPRFRSISRLGLVRHFEATQFVSTCVPFIPNVLRAELTEDPIILIVEDDEAIQSIVEDALTDGLRARGCKNSREAATLLKRRVAAYRAVIIDIQLLGRSDGGDVGRAAREIDPHFPVIYMSGVAADQWTIQGVPDSIMLQKPFAPRS